MSSATRSGSIVAIACLGGLLSGLDTAVNIAFPAIAAAFDLDVADIQWVVICFVLTYSVLLLPLGRVGDRVGHRRVFGAGLAVSALGLAGCALSTGFGVFLVSRVVQGLGIALVLASAPAMITVSVTEANQPRALGWFQMATALGIAAGAPMGGLLLEVWGWSGVFAFRVPYCLLLLGWVMWGRVATPGERQRESGPLDVAGALSLALGLGALVVALSRGMTWGWASPQTLVLTVVGVAALGMFVRVEASSSKPLVDLTLFLRPHFGMANVLNALAHAAMFAVLFLVPFLLVTVRGHGPVGGGLILASAPIAQAVASVASGRWVGRVSLRRQSAAGLLVLAAGLGWLSQLGVDTPTGIIVVAGGLVGLGLGAFLVPNMSFVMSSIELEQQGVAGGMVQMVRTAGLVFGLAVWNVVFVARRDAAAARHGIDDLDSAAAFVPAFGSVLGWAALTALVAAVLALVRRRPPAIAGSPS